MNVAPIGAGRIELVAAAGLLVQCVDIDETKIDALKAGSVPFHDPGLMELLEKNRTSAAAALLKHERLSFFDDPYEAASGADALAVLTEWNEFRILGPSELKRAMRGAVLLDARNVFVPEAMAPVGFCLSGRGRRPKASAVPDTSEIGMNR